MDQSDLAEFRKAMAAIRDFANADESTMVTMPNGVKVPSLRRGVDIARNKGKTIGQRLLNIRRHLFQHGITPAHMKASNDHGNTGLKKRLPYIKGTRELVCLNPDEADHTTKSATNTPDNLFRWDDGIGFIIELHMNVDVLSQHLSFHTVHG